MTKHPAVDLKLNNCPDEYGFIYGRLRKGDEDYSINVLPPKSNWAGQQILCGHEPDDREWVLYLDGQEFARVEKREDIESKCRQKLLT